jgi:hypothetical protein
MHESVPWLKISSQRVGVPVESYYRLPPDLVPEESVVLMVVT